VNVVDSSGWLEYFAGGPGAAFFAPAVEDRARLIVPAISIFEVVKRVLSQSGEAEAAEVVGAMHEGVVVDLDTDLAIRAAKLSVETKLPMADSIILATAQAYGATLWTQDADFAAIPGVKYRSKK
jgi:predicted nucleic acid-binding protein